MLVPAALALMMQTSPLSAEANALLDQQAVRLGEAMADMSLALGRCATVYPLGQADPDVRDARQAIAELGSPEMSDAMARVEALGFAQGIEDGRRTPPSISDCAGDIPDTAAHLRQVAQAMGDLARRLSQ